jgi:hypothetical protein
MSDDIVKVWNLDCHVPSSKNVVWCDALSNVALHSRLLALSGDLQSDRLTASLTQLQQRDMLREFVSQYLRASAFFRLLVGI